MKKYILVFIIILSVSISCTVNWTGVIRNKTGYTATIDVYLVNRANMKHLPNQIRYEKDKEEINKSFIKSMTNIDTVEWIGTDHFRYSIKPHTVILLEDFGIRLVNGLIFSNALAIVNNQGKMDTIKDGEMILTKFKEINGVRCYDIIDSR